MFIACAQDTLKDRHGSLCPGERLKRSCVYSYIPTEPNSLTAFTPLLVPTPCPHSCLECLLLLCFVDRISCSASDLKLVPEDGLELILELLKVVHLLG